MTRLHQFTRGLSYSWLATAATVVYSLLSVPIALQYLSVEEFGLFVLLLQVAAYFSLVEMGISAAAARILVEYKDKPNAGNYGSVILTGLLVFSIQSLIILAFGLVAAPAIISAIRVPATLADDAVFLLRWLAVSSALSIASRMYTSVLYANKRIDVLNIIIAFSVLLGILLLAVILVAGGGLVHLAWLFMLQTIVSILLCVVTCYKLALLPRKGDWGKPSMARFRELFGFGKDIFLVNVGNQVLEASQLIIVTRTMGLTAAAIWSVSTKLFTLVYQVVTKIEGTAIVFFAEMIVRGEVDKLAARFRQIYQLTGAIAVVSLAIVVAINGPFVSVWANTSLAWSLPLSGLFAVAVLLNALTRCSGDLIIHTKKIAAFRYIYFLEAVIFVVLSLLLSAHFGFYGILGASIVCLLMFRATYTTWRMAHYFKLPAKTFWWTWLKRPILAALILTPVAMTTDWLTGSMSNPWGQFFIASAWIGLPATLVLFLVALPRDVGNEIALRLPQFSFFGKR